MAWVKGQSGNPLGRPKGSRDKLSERFYAEVAEDWYKHGSDVIRAVRENQPATYLQVVARLLPSSHEFSVSHFRDVDVSSVPLSMKEWRAAYCIIEGEASEIPAVEDAEGKR